MAEPKGPPDINIATIRTAETLIERHGDGALAFAQAQADRLAKTGSETSAVDWRGVVLAIKQILAGKKRRD
jgi:hypothetical protein